MKRKARRLQYAGVIVLLLFAVLYTKEEITLAGNESSRFGVIQALGEQGVFHIERTNFASTVDRVEWNGHVYSDKPLPLSSAAAVVHGTVHRLTGINFSENRMLAIYLINLLFSGGCNILLFLWMFRLLRRTCRGSSMFAGFSCISCRRRTCAQNSCHHKTSCHYHKFLHNVPPCILLAAVASRFSQPFLSFTPVSIQCRLHPFFLPLPILTPKPLIQLHQRLYQRLHLIFRQIACQALDHLPVEPGVMPIRFSAPL